MYHILKNVRDFSVELENGFIGSGESFDQSKNLTQITLLR